MSESLIRLFPCSNRGQILSERAAAGAAAATQALHGPLKPTRSRLGAHAEAVGPGLSAVRRAAQGRWMERGHGDARGSRAPRAERLLKRRAQSAAPRMRQNKEKRRRHTQQRLTEARRRCARGARAAWTVDSLKRVSNFSCPYLFMVLRQRRLRRGDQGRGYRGQAGPARPQKQQSGPDCRRLPPLGSG